MARSTIKSRARAIAWKQLVLKREVDKCLALIRDHVTATICEEGTLPHHLPIYDIRTWAITACSCSGEAHALTDAFMYSEDLSLGDAIRMLDKARKEILAREESDRAKRKADHG